ncbi:PPE domain-containing protein [Saccharopolyspora sp. NPDC049426]|uniref:WXG100-like domain-containing protein n=1 Tax=Saccharopolyspora sp. NPDC049426 TaxID=3155652 RepID=UPI00341F6174
MPQDSPDLALVETQNWASRSHRELYDAVHIENDPGRVGQLADEWTKLSRAMAESADRMSEQLRATESGWQGEAADAARSAIEKLANWSRDAGESAGALADRVSEQGRVMETAKAEMPEPVKGGKEIHTIAALTFATGDLESFTKAMGDLRANQERSSSAHEQAVRVMTRMEESSRVIDGDTPRFTPPPDPIEELKPRKTVQSLAATEANGPGEAPTQQQSAGGGAEATQKMTRPASAPVAQQPAAPPLAAQTGPAGVGPDGMPLAAQTGPAGANAPTKKMQIPKIGGPNSMDSPTIRANPVNPAKPPSLEDHKPKNTTAQNATPFQGGDGQTEKTQKLRPHQGPDGQAFGPGGRRPGKPNDRDGNRKWGGQIPPIPNTNGPDGDIPPISQTKAAGGSSGGAGGLGATPPPMPSGGAAGSSITPGGTSGIGGSPAGDHGGAGPVQGGGGTPGQTSAGGAGGMMGGGAMGNRGGQGSEDEARKAKYVEGGPVVEVPGKDLPPPVIGEGKKKKKSEE